MRALKALRFVHVVVFSLALSTFTTSLVCGSGLKTARAATDCCKMMHSACHKKTGHNPCCQHQPSAPDQLALLPTSPEGHVAPPVIAVALVPAVAPLSLPNLPAHLVFRSSLAHSPPAGISLFLLHSTLLI